MLLLQVNERKFWREHWQHDFLFLWLIKNHHKDCRSQKVLCWQVHWICWALKIHRRFIHWPLLVIKSKTLLWLFFLCVQCLCTPMESAENLQKKNASISDISPPVLFHHQVPKPHQDSYQSKTFCFKLSSSKGKVWSMFFSKFKSRLMKNNYININALE